MASVGPSVSLSVCLSVSQSAPYSLFKYTFLGSNASHAIFRRTAMLLIAACCVVCVSLSFMRCRTYCYRWYAYYGQSVCLSVSQSAPCDVVNDFSAKLHILCEMLKYMIFKYISCVPCGVSPVRDYYGVRRSVRLSVCLSVCLSVSQSAPYNAGLNHFATKLHILCQILKYMVFKYTFLEFNASHAVFRRTAMLLIATCCVVCVSLSFVRCRTYCYLWYAYYGQSVCLSVCLVALSVCLFHQKPSRFHPYVSVHVSRSAMRFIATVSHIAWSVYLRIFRDMHGLFLLMTQSVCLSVVLVGLYVCHFHLKTRSNLSACFFTCTGSVMRPIATVSHILWSVYPTSVTDINITHADYCYTYSRCWAKPLIFFMFGV